MRSRRFLIVVVLAQCCLFCLVGDLRAAGGPGTSRWAPGMEWELTVKQYSRNWMLAFSDPKDRASAQVPRVAHEYCVTARVTAVTTKKGRDLVEVTFSHEPDASADVKDQRCVLVFDAETLRAVSLIQTSPGTEGGVHVHEWTDKGTAVFTHGDAWGAPVDWVIDAADEGKRAAAVEDVALDERRPTGWQVHRTVTPQADGTTRVKASRLGSREPDARTDVEVEVEWDPAIGWWRSFRRTLEGHIDIEATLITGKSPDSQPAAPAGTAPNPATDADAAAPSKEPARAPTADP